MRLTAVGILCMTPLLAVGGEPAARECSILNVREIVMSETRGGPQPPTADGIAPASVDSRYQVTMRCGERTLSAIFTTRGGFDAERFSVGSRVSASVDAQTVRLHRSDAPNAVGSLVSQSPNK